MIRTLCSYLTKAALGLAALLLFNSSAVAGDITVLAAGAAKELVARIEAPFTLYNGHRIKATFDTVGAQRARVEKGERPDAVILSSAAIAQLNKLGLIDAATVRDVGDVQVGLAVSANSMTPDISTAQALRKVLLAAKSIAYADPARGATAGAHFAKVLAALGISDQVASKVTVLPFGVEVIEAVAAGKFDLGVSQSSEIVQHKNVRYIGALPVPHQLATRYQIAALKDRPLGISLADFVVTERGKQASRDSGFETPR
ncbi:MAG: substrate-binding domain-containing protein [Casimicrobium sp.]